MRVLVGFESSGIVREAFRRRGHDAWSCDLLPAEDGSPYHLQCDVFEVIHDGWDLGIFHPECTYPTVSGLHWNKRRPERAAATEAALDTVVRIMNCEIPRWAIENPKGCISTRILWKNAEDVWVPAKPSQVIQPFEFGEDASKETHLWLHNLPPLTKGPYRRPSKLVWESDRPKKVARRWANQTDSGQNALPPSKDRWRDRSRTYPSVAEAMARDWGNLMEPER